MRTRTLGLVAILLAVFVDLLGVTIVTVALPSITTDLDASAAQAQAVLSGYTLTFAVGMRTLTTPWSAPYDDATARLIAWWLPAFVAQYLVESLAAHFNAVTDSINVTRLDGCTQTFCCT